MYQRGQHIKSFIMLVTRYKITSWTVFIISFTGITVGVTVDDGSVCREEEVTGHCPENTNEIYTDSGHSKICCEIGTKAEKNEKIKAASCRSSNCIPGPGNDGDNFEDFCSSPKYLVSRDINGRKLEYENMMMEDRCKNGTKQYGMTALCCPKNSNDSYLVTTFGAEPNEFPHLAKITSPGHCSATVYNKRFLITAAHCVVDDFDGNVKPLHRIIVTLGASSVADMSNERFEYKVLRVIPHEGYSKLKGNPEREKGYVRDFNDIALIELSKDIQFGDSVKALEIAPKAFKPEEYSDQAVVVGWGRQPKNFEWTHLQKSNFLLRNDSACFDVLGGYWWTMDSKKDQLLCLGGILDRNWSPIVGRGDSGGPAVCRNNEGHPVLCGITSFGPPYQRCLDNQNEKSCPPSIFVDVGYFHDWIKENAGEQETWTLHKPYLYGRPVAKVLYEHQVHITSDTGNPCGGTLLTDNVVVTAAHCVFQGDDFGVGDVHAGLLVAAENGERFPVEEAQHAPNFKRVWPRLDIALAHDVFANRDHHKLAKDYFHSNDLALIKLKGKVSIDPESIPRIPINNERFSFAREVTYTRNTTNLMDRNFKILERVDCGKRLERLSDAGMRVKFGGGLLCGVEVYSGGSTCDRELGGGLICRRLGDNKPILCGIQVFRFCERSYPNLFVDIGFQLNRKWIEDILARWST